MHNYYKRLNDEFETNQFVAGERFTVADITLLCGVDFASTLVGLPPSEELSHLKRWHEEVSSRPSVIPLSELKSD